MPFCTFFSPSSSRLYSVQVLNGILDVKEIPLPEVKYQSCLGSPEYECMLITDDDQVYWLREPGRKDITPSDLNSLLTFIDHGVEGPLSRVTPLCGQDISKIIFNRRRCYFLKQGEVYTLARRNERKRRSHQYEPSVHPFKVSSPEIIVDVQSCGVVAFFLSSTGQVKSFHPYKSFVWMKALVYSPDRCHTVLKKFPSFPPVYFPQEVKQIACGSMHVTFLDYEGKIYGFRRRRDCSSDWNFAESFDVPIEIPSVTEIGLEARSIYARENVSYFLTYDGRCYTFGNGDAWNGVSNNLEQIKGTEAVFIDEIIAGLDITLLMDTEGKIYYILEAGAEVTEIAKVTEGIKERRHTQMKSSLKRI